MRLSADRPRWFVPDLFVRERQAHWPWRPASAECPSGRSERDPWRCEAESTALCFSRWGEPPCGPASRPLVSAWGTATSPCSAATSKHTLSYSYSAEALINCRDLAELAAIFIRDRQTLKNGNEKNSVKEYNRISIKFISSCFLNLSISLTVFVLGSK